MLHFDSTILIYFLMAFSSGLVAVPVGGSLLFIIPVYLLLGLDGLQALLLARIGMVAIMGSSSSHFMRYRIFHWKKILLFIFGNALGFVIAAKVATAVSPYLLTKIVPWLLIAGVALSEVNLKFDNPKLKNLFINLLPFLGLLIGFYSGIGISGGAQIITLLLIFVFGWEIKTAIINTRLIEFISNIFAVLAYFYFGAKLTGFEIPVFIGGLLGGLIGARITLKSKPIWLKRAFIFLALFTAIKMLM